MPVNMEQVCQRVYPSVRQVSRLTQKNAGVVELVDTMDSKSIGRKPVPVQVRLSVPTLRVVEHANLSSRGAASHARRVKRHVVRQKLGEHRRKAERRVIELANPISPKGASYARRAPCEARNKLDNAGARLRRGFGVNQQEPGLPPQNYLWKGDRVRLHLLHTDIQILYPQTSNPKQRLLAP
jgi:hypothetical protein